MRVQAIVTVAALFSGVPTLACESCEHPEKDVVFERLVRRMQPDALNATVQPRGALAWGQLNFMHTTDTHGWLEGHLKVRQQWYPTSTHADIKFRSRTMEQIGETMHPLPEQ